MFKKCIVSHVHVTVKPGSRVILKSLLFECIVFRPWKLSLENWLKFILEVFVFKKCIVSHVLVTVKPGSRVILKSLLFDCVILRRWKLSLENWLKFILEVFVAKKCIVSHGQGLKIIKECIKKCFFILYQVTSVGPYCNFWLKDCRKK